MSANSKPVKAFPLPDVLRDLALLRVSEVNLASLVPASSGSSSESTLDSDLKKSYQLTKEARAAIRLRDGGKVEDEVVKLESARSALEEFVKGLEGGRE